MDPLYPCRLAAAHESCGQSRTKVEEYDGCVAVDLFHEFRGSDRSRVHIVFHVHRSVHDCADAFAKFQRFNIKIDDVAHLPGRAVHLPWNANADGQRFVGQYAGDAHDVGYDIAFTGVRWHTADVDDAVCCVEQHASIFVPPMSMPTHPCERPLWCSLAFIACTCLK